MLHFTRKILKKCLNQFGYQVSSLESFKFSEPFCDLSRLYQNKQNITIFDVGAHLGETVSCFRKHFPTAVIHAFEPFSDSYNKLCQRTSEDHFTQTFNYGLSDQSGFHKFNINSSDATNSLLKTDKLAKKTWESDIVETQKEMSCEFKTLDEHYKEHSLVHIDILKLDVQGAEPLVLKGAQQTISNNKIGCIYTEIILQPTYESQLRFDMYLNQIFNCGFTLYNIYNLNHNKEGLLRQIDAIFIKTKSSAS